MNSTKPFSGEEVAEFYNEITETLGVGQSGRLSSGDFLEIFHRFLAGLDYFSQLASEWWTKIEQSEKLDVRNPVWAPLNLIVDRCGYKWTPEQYPEAQKAQALGVLPIHFNGSKAALEIEALNALWNGAVEAGHALRHYV